MDKASVFCEDCFSRPNREEIEKQAGGIHGQKKKEKRKLLTWKRLTLLVIIVDLIKSIMEL